MWEQYADQHRGACLLFDGERLKASLETAFKQQRILSWLRAVRYTPAGMMGSALLKYFDDPRIFEGHSPRAIAVAEFVENNSDDFFFLKSDDFETEHEFRAVVMPGTEGTNAHESQDVLVNGDHVFVDYGDTLRFVIVGERFPNWQLLGANRACERASAKLGKIGWEYGRPVAFPPTLDDHG